MNDAEPAPPTDPVQPPEPAKEGWQSVSAGRLVFNGLALLLSGLTIAPIGIFFDTDLANYMPRGGETAITVIYWAGFLALAGYATFTRNQPRGQFLTFLVCGLALLNLHGCVAGLSGIGRATG